jgi:hypothetical protein
LLDHDAVYYVREDELTKVLPRDAASKTPTTNAAS